MEDIRTNDGLIAEETPKKKRKNIGGVLVAIGAVLFIIGWLMGARGANIGWHDGRLRFIAAAESEDIVIQEFVTNIRISSRSANIEILGHSGSEISVNLIGVEAEVFVHDHILGVHTNR